MTALLVCLAIGGSLVVLGFYIGREHERQQPDAQVYVLPPSVIRRHPSQDFRPAHHERTVHGRHLRLVTPIFDFDSQEPA